MVTEDTATMLINDAFGDSVQTVTPVRSGVNTSYNITTETSSYFLKFGTDNNTETILAEAALLKTLDGVIPTPTIHTAGVIDGTSYFIASWIDGVQPNHDLTNSDTWLATELGRHLAVLHTELSFPPGEPQSPNGTDLHINKLDWSTLFKNWLVTHAEDAKKNYPGIGSDIMRLIHWCDMPPLTGEGVLTPLDYHGGNVLTKDNQIAAVIDFERCYSGHPGWSYITSKRVIGRSDPALAEAFETGYASVRDPPAPHPALELGAMIRELRMAHMLFENPAEHKPTYRQDINAIEQRLS